MKKLLVVRPAFGDIFLEESRSILKEKYIVENFLTDINFDKNNIISKYYHKILNIIFRNLLNKRDYYQKLSEKNKKHLYKCSLKRIKNKKYDVILVFRGDRVPEFALKELSKHTQKFINYQFDGISMCPDIFLKRKYFTDFFSFEKEDIKLYPELKMKFITNFYFNPIISQKRKENIDFYYVGTGTNERIEYLKNFAFYFAEYKNFFLLTSSKNLPYPLTNLCSPVPYKENLNNVQNCKCIIDIKLENHNGLSFRFFEALFYEKKIITNNQSIKEYDFYHPHNILVTDYKNIDQNQILNFLNLSYSTIDKSIVSKYSLSSWLSTILNINNTYDS